MWGAGGRPRPDDYVHSERGGLAPGNAALLERAVEIITTPGAGAVPQQEIRV